ncbi:MAG: hypothetical protein FP816_12045 [Desulfobacteraceae bacterium]|nr:hypothetical protein [Desulfobacteraceae bacterium]
MLKKTLQDTWYFFRIHVMPLSAIILPILVPTEIITSLYSYYFTGEDFVLLEQIPTVIIGFLTYPVYSVGVIFYIASIIDGKVIDTKTAWFLGIKFWGPYLVLRILMGISIAGGIMLLIIPGVIFAVRYSFSEFDLLLNNPNPLEAMKNSWTLTRKYMLVLLGGYAVIGISLFLPYYAVLSFFNESNVVLRVLAGMLLIMIHAVMEVLFTIFAFRVYDDTRGQNNREIRRDVTTV